MNKPHKHAAVIIAWASGHAVEERRMCCGEWQPWKPIISPNPSWWEDSCYEFRVAPKPDRVIYAHIESSTRFSIRIAITCEHNWNSNNEPSYTLPCNAKLTFDGETGDLKDMELVK